MKALLRLYPRAWRRRYGDEMAALIADQEASVRLVVDLIAGAIDARINPQPLRDDTVGSPDDGGTTMTKSILHCDTARLQQLSAADQWKGVAWMLGGTLALAVAHIALRWTFGSTLLIDAFGTSVFPFAVVLAMRGTYFRPYSASARAVMIGGLMLAVFLLSLAGTWLAHLT
jgi:hypothetical protein